MLRVAVALLAGCLLGPPALAQRVRLEFGGKVGVPITRPVPPLGNPFGATATTEYLQPRMSFGPSAAVLVQDSLVVDVDAIFRPVRYDQRTEESCCSTLEAVRATAVELPVFVSYRARRVRLRPYAGAGLVLYEKQWGKTDTRNTLHQQGDRQTHVVFRYPSFGSSSLPPPLLFGGGVVLSEGGVVLRPELRYTHWRGQTLRSLNQWDVFLGIGFSVLRFR